MYLKKKIETSVLYNVLMTDIIKLGGLNMNKFELVKNIMRNLKKEFGEIDITEISSEDLADTVRKLKNNTLE